MRGRLLRTLWLSAQGALALWFLLGTAVDRQFIFFVVLALSFPAGFLVYGAAPVGVAVEELFHLDLWVLWNALMWVAVVVAGYWQWFVWVPRYGLVSGRGHG